MSEFIELTVNGRSEDGNSLDLVGADGATFTLPITDRLKSLVNQPRLVAVVPTNTQSTLTAKEVQARLRSGESIDLISRTSDWSAEKIEKFSGPIMQERAYVIGLALASTLGKEKHSPTLATATISQLEPRGVDMTEVEWNTWRLPDGLWNILLKYPTKDGGLGEANWTFDQESRTLEAEDDSAAWISGDELPTRPEVPTHGMIYARAQEAPKLVSIKETVVKIDSSVPQEAVPSEDRNDGVRTRIKIPSWDDIMFGSSKETSEEE